jgi:G3E family GTPase
MEQTLIPVTVIGGYLGSGKTTLLNALLRGAHGLRLAVLVNDFGSINIDAELIAAHDGDTISLANGCICCSLRDNLGAAFYALAARPDPPDHVVIEASGVADPQRIAHYAQAIPGLRLDGIIVLADAELIRRQARDKYVGDTVLRQLQAADLIVLSKIDLVAPDAVADVRAWLVTHAPGAPIMEAVAGQLPLAYTLGRDPASDAAILARLPETGPALPGEHVHDHERHDLVFDQVTFTTDTPCERSALTAAMAALPPAVVRAKGVVYLADAPEHRFILQLVGRRWTLQQDAPWGDEPPSTRLVLIAPHGQVDAGVLQTELGKVFEAGCRP